MITIQIHFEIGSLKVTVVVAQEKIEKKSVCDWLICFECISKRWN